jgi:hypothetical protein
VHLVRVDREIHALDDLGAVFERDVKILDLEKCQVRDSPSLDGFRASLDGS